MAKASDAVPVDGYSSTVRKVMLVNSSGVPSGAYPNYEAKKFSPGASQTDYDVKTAKSMFAIVTKSGQTTIKNKDSSNIMTVKLNATSKDSFDVEPNSIVTLNTYLVTNIFITTPVGFTGAVEVILFG
jgi:hypothetical protein